MTFSFDKIARRPRAFLLQVLPAVGYAAAVFYAGLIRMDDLPEVGFVPTDKLLHAAVFGGLTWLLSRALRFCLPQAALSKCLWLGALGASLLGALLELCQALVPYRSADPLDWVADSVGAGLALLVSLAFVRLVRMPVEG